MIYFLPTVQVSELEATAIVNRILPLTCVYVFADHHLTERSGKKDQYELAKKILKQEIRYSGGFFIFYDEQGNFRFSLVYDIPLSSGRREWSNFKRYTYYVSKGQTNKTFIQQMSEADFSSLDSIIEAFSVEKVTREFYNEIANWYFWALEKVKFPDDAEQQPNGRNIALIRFITESSLFGLWEKLIIRNFSTMSKLKYLKNTDDEKAPITKPFFRISLLHLTILSRKEIQKEGNSKAKRDYMNHGYAITIFSVIRGRHRHSFNEIPSQRWPV